MNKKSHKIWKNKYFMNRYYNDPTFRKKHLKDVKKWQDENLEHIRERERISYANRTTTQIKKRKKYLKELRKKRLKKSS